MSQASADNQQPRGAPDEPAPEGAAESKGRQVAGAVVDGFRDVLGPPARLIELVGDHLILLVRALSWLPRRPYRFSNYLDAGEYIGFGSLPIIILVGVFTGMMQPAADRVRDALADVTISAPTVPVVANVSAEPNDQADRIAELLVAQVTGAVLWEQSVTRLVQMGVERAYELGNGAVLKGLVKRIDKSLSVSPVGGPADIAAFAA